MKFTGRAQGVKGATPRRRNPSAPKRRPNQALTPAEDAFLKSICNNYLSVAQLSARDRVMLDKLIELDYVRRTNGHIEATDKGQAVAGVRRGNPVQLPAWAEAWVASYGKRSNLSKQNLRRAAKAVSEIPLGESRSDIESFALSYVPAGGRRVSSAWKASLKRAFWSAYQARATSSGRRPNIGLPGGIRRSKHEPRLVKQWATRGGKYWLKLYERTDGTFWLESQWGGSNFGKMTFPQALVEVNKRIRDAKEIDNRTYKEVPVSPRLRENPGKYDDNPILRNIVGRLHVGAPDEEVWAYVKSRLAKGGRGIDRRTLAALKRSALKIHAENRGLYGRVMRGNPGARRPNPGFALAVVNPLPDHLERFVAEQGLSPAEREEFNQAVAKYCEFHGVAADDISILELNDDDVPDVIASDGANRFLVGIGDTEDVSYSANHKNTYTSSNKKGTPFRHEFPSKPHMATDPHGAMLFVINKPDQRDHFQVVDWIRG